MTQEFRMHCGLVDGQAGLLRVMSTAIHPAYKKMLTHLTELEVSVTRMKQILLEEANNDGIEL